MTHFNLAEYQKNIRSFVRFPEDQAEIYLTYLLAEEIGEVFGVYSKSIRDHNQALQAEKLVLELGDVLWAAAALLDWLPHENSEFQPPFDPSSVTRSSIQTSQQASSLCKSELRLLQDRLHCILSTPSRAEQTQALQDILALVSQLAKEIGTTLEFVADKNLEKLHSRLARNKISGSGDFR